MSGIPSAQLALETENHRLRERIAGLERMLAGESAQQSALSDREWSHDGSDQSYKTLAELVQRAPFGIYIVDSQFRIMHINACLGNWTVPQRAAGNRARLGRDNANALAGHGCCRNHRGLSPHPQYRRTALCAQRIQPASRRGIR